ncbi:hypothetical protein ABT173_42775 [Streptomyces sp. NPDC001795]|uniref:hypothetical protein n=1 Tax=Streptomyces sp. NPDC001795 TaxID=3154525 RepID=UPI00331E0F47
MKYVRHDRPSAELDLTTAATGPVVALALGLSGRTVHADRVSASGDLDTEVRVTASAPAPRCSPA